MFSKFLRFAGPLQPLKLLRRVKMVPIAHKIVRNTYYYVPPNQYDMPIPRMLHLFQTLRVNWEIIPLVFVTALAMTLCCLMIIYKCLNAVDVVFTVNSRNNISRTMDLRNPFIAKLICINQRYERWPEMQDVLDKMKAAEKRALVRAQACSLP